MRRPARILYAVSAVVFCCVLSRSAMAADTLTATLEQAFVAEPGEDAAHVLARDGARFEAIALAERLPNGMWMVESTLRLGAHVVRWPSRMKRTPSGWMIDWQPQPEFASALTALVRSGRLPLSQRALPTGEIRRLPAFPVVMTGKRYVTPFGAIDRPATTTKELTPSIPLLKHAQRWLKLLHEDPAPAAVDVLVDANLSWHDLNELIFSVSAVGLYQLFIQTVVDGEGLGSIPASAPIAAFQREGSAPPLVIGMYPLEGSVGFRIGVGGELVTGDAPCAAEMTLCVTSPATFREQMTAMIAEKLPPDGERTKHAMFAATGDVTIAEGIRYLDEALPALKLAPHAVLLGYIQK